MSDALGQGSSEVSYAEEPELDEREGGLISPSHDGSVPSLRVAR